MKKPSLADLLPLSDLTQMASGAASALGDVRGEMRTMMQSQIEKALAKRGLVAREDFDALEARLAKAIMRIEELESRLAEAAAAKPAKKGQQSGKKITKNGPVDKRRESPLTIKKPLTLVGEGPANH